MTTVISITLYFLAAFLACCVGVEAEKHKRGAANVSTAKFTIVSFSVLFLMAVALQVTA